MLNYKKTMKIMKSKWIALTILAGLLIGCTQDLSLFDENAYVSINLETNDEGFAEYSYTFQYLAPDIQEAEIHIPVTLAGRPSHLAENFSVHVIDSLTSAIAGTHYQLDTSLNVIEPNSFDGSIYIKLLKTAEMNDTSYTLGLEIVNNSYYKYGPNNKVVITFSNKLEKPEWWYTDPTANIGYYTQRKLALWFEFWEITDGSDPWETIKEWKYNRWIYDRDRAAADKEMFKAWLNEKPEEEVTDEYGDLVILTLYRLER